MFLPPPQDGNSFKELFRRAAAAGAGRPVGDDGFPAGPWTSELLAEAISQIDSNRLGIDLRTVQLWFQENDKGISATNIRWLARIFGCDDPVATGEWQVALSTAQSQLSAKRREQKRVERSGTLAVRDTPPATASFGEIAPIPGSPGYADVVESKERLGLASKTEAQFNRGSPLNLSVLVFAGISGLGFLSFSLGIHSITYVRSDGIIKQVGFLWALNWILVFMVFLPLFLAIVSELVTSWKTAGRKILVGDDGDANGAHSWGRIVDASSYSFWAVFLICVLFAGVIQWVGVCLIPISGGGGNFATDWGTISIIDPERISASMEILFTGIAYLYMCVCFYLFFAGLILLSAVVYDLSTIARSSNDQHTTSFRTDLDQTGAMVMAWIFRCTILGILMAIVMKLQSSYLASNGHNIISWLSNDLLSTLYDTPDAPNRFRYTMPTHYSSLLIAFSSCVVFVYGMVRLGAGNSLRTPLWKMSLVVAQLVATYLLIDAFRGFSILLFMALLLALYGLIGAGIGGRRATETGSRQGVS